MCSQILKRYYFVINYGAKGARLYVKKMCNDRMENSGFQSSQVNKFSSYISVSKLDQIRRVDMARTFINIEVLSTNMSIE